MAKLTSEQLKAAMQTYVNAAKQAGAWTASTDNFAGLLDKIGKTIQLSGLYNDQLPELDAESLEYARTIEEYFINLTMPTAYTDITTEAAKNLTPALPSVNEVCYSYSLGRQKIKTTVPYDNIERAFNSAEDASNALTDITIKLQNSYDITKYYEKKQLLGNAISKCLAQKATNPDVYKAIAKPVDTATSEAFIQQAKADVEDASFAHEGGLNKAFIGASPELILFVKKGVIPSIQVTAMAGAFQKDELAIPARIKVVEDFGTITGGTDGKEVFALLADPRGIKLHNCYNATREAPNADADCTSYVRHFEDVAFISKYVYMKVYETA